MLSSSEQLCPHCQTSVPAGAKFCGNCGQSMAGAYSVSAAPLSTGLDEPGTLPFSAASSSQGAEASESNSSSYATAVAVAPPPPAPVPLSPSTLPPIQQRLSIGRRFLFAALVLLLLLGAGGVVDAYILTRLHPVVAVTGSYVVSSTPAGTKTAFYGNNVFHVSGQHFWTHSPITFLLDGNLLSGTPDVQSDSNGAFAVNLTITNNWRSGFHNLTARDAKGYTAQTSRRIDIVAPLYQNDLTNVNSSDWDCGNDTVCKSQPDGYHIQGAVNFVVWSHLLQPLTNLALEVSGMVATGDPTQPTCLYIEFHVPPVNEQEGYGFAVCVDGTCQLVQWDSQGKSSTLIASISSSAIHQGFHQENEIKIMAEGDNFTFFINGQLVTQFQSNAYQSGYIGLAVNGENGTEAEAVFSNLLITA